MPTHYRQNAVIAAIAMIAGAGFVSAGVAWSPVRGEAQALSRGALVYAGTCAGCHGENLEGRTVHRQSGTRVWPSAPPLDGTGHAWQHSDAQLAEIVAHGMVGTAAQGSSSGMPAFAEQLSHDEIRAVVVYVKSRWPIRLRVHQAALNAGQGQILAALLRDPAATLPSTCLLPPAVANSP